MAQSALKKLRLKAGMTQTQVAEAMGVSQPNYQRWESGAAPVPAAKVKKLAKVLEATSDEVLGKPAPFDLFGINEKVGDARKYFGEVAVHFGATKPLLLPISEKTRSQIYSQLQGGSSFILAESLDNRTVYIRRTAIKDLYLSSEAHDTYGPGKYEGHIGVLPDDDFWYIVENMESLDDLDEPLDEKRVEEVLKQIQLTDDDLDELIATGKIPPEDRDKVRKDADSQTEKFYERATRAVWQLSSGQVRSEYVDEDRVLYDAFSLLDLDPDDMDDLIHVPVDGYHRSIFIRRSEIDYVSVPTHKFQAGSLETAEEVLDGR